MNIDTYEKERSYKILSVNDSIFQDYWKKKLQTLYHNLWNEDSEAQSLLEPRFDNVTDYVYKVLSKDFIDSSNASFNRTTSGSQFDEITITFVLGKKYKVENKLILIITDNTIMYKLNPGIDFKVYQLKDYYKVLKIIKAICLLDKTDLENELDIVSNDLVLNFRTLEIASNSMKVLFDSILGDNSSYECSESIDGLWVYKKPYSGRNTKLLRYSDFIKNPDKTKSYFNLLKERENRQ